MRNKKNIEMRLYELLGIKAFRKMAFKLRDILAYPLTFKMSKEEKYNFLYNTASNYNIGKVKNLESVKKFKKQLIINTCIHIWALKFCLPDFIKDISNLNFSPLTLVYFTCIGVNLYCIMLQRYNAIRINKLIKKLTPIYEKKKNVIKDELKKEDSLLLNHTYKIIDKKEKETDITFNDLIEKASIEQLKKYHEYLAYFKNINQSIQKKYFYSDKNQVDIIVSIEKNKALKLELNSNKRKNC